MSQTLVRAVSLAASVLVAACHHAGAPVVNTQPVATTGATSSSPATQSGRPAASAPASISTASVQLGDSLFNSGGCKNCHGVGGKGAQNGPALAAAKWTHISGSFDEIVKIITTGIAANEIKDPSHRFAMRARGGPMNLTDDQIKAVAAYVVSLNKH